MVSEVDTEKRRLSLSLRATEPNPWEQVAETHQVGSRINGVVRNLTDFGAFVEIVPGVDGLVHISDMSWTRRINHPSEVVSEGTGGRGGDHLGRRAQSADFPIHEGAPAERVGGVRELPRRRRRGLGLGHQHHRFRVFVELAPGVEGLCHISEIDRDSGLALAEMFTAGQKVVCRILRIDWNENRIGLSMHGVPQEAVEAVARVRNWNPPSPPKPPWRQHSGRLGAWWTKKKRRPWRLTK